MVEKLFFFTFKWCHGPYTSCILWYPIMFSINLIFLTFFSLTKLVFCFGRGTPYCTQGLYLAVLREMSICSAKDRTQIRIQISHIQIRRCIISSTSKIDILWRLTKITYHFISYFLTFNFCYCLHNRVAMVFICIYWWVKLLNFTSPQKKKK